MRDWLYKLFSVALWRGLGRRAVEWLVGFHGSPQEVARGLALGVFVAFTPTLGFQMIIAGILATLTHSSRAAAIAVVWITNPLTSVPILSLTYQVGHWFAPGPALGDVRRQLSAVLLPEEEPAEWFDLVDQLRELAGLGSTLLVPLWVGGGVVGTAAAAVTYPVALWAGKLGQRWAARGTGT